MALSVTELTLRDAIIGLGLSISSVSINTDDANPRCIWVSVETRVELTPKNIARIQRVVDDHIPVGSLAELTVVHALEPKPLNITIAKPSPAPLSGSLEELRGCFRPKPE